MNEEARSEVDAGTKLGKYEIVRLIGAGAMAAVYEATDADTGRRVAIKILDARLAARPEARERFLHEARITKRLRHLHVVDVIDAGESDGCSYLVMELLDGEDLGHRVERAGALSPQDAADILVPVCGAIAAAHKAGITHRDLKPHNIFLTTRAGGVHPKVLDFGISISAKAEAVQPAANGKSRGAVTLVGSPCYLAPEQVVSSQAAGPSSDQYALGVIAYECLTGRRPYDGDNLNAVLQAIAAGRAEPMRAHRPEIPEAFEAVVLRAMSRHPSDRFEAVIDLGRALLPFASGRVRLFWEGTFADRRSSTRSEATPTPIIGIQAAERPAEPAAAPAAPVAQAAPAAALTMLGFAAPVAPPAVQTAALPAPVEPVAADDDPGATLSQTASAQRWSSADLRERLGSPRRRSPSSPAIAAEAATPSPFTRTLPPEAPELYDVSEPSMVPPVAIEASGVARSPAFEEGMAPVVAPGARGLGSKWLRLGGGAAIALGAVALLLARGGSSQPKPAMIVPAAAPAPVVVPVAPPAPEIVPTPPTPPAPEPVTSVAEEKPAVEAKPVIDEQPTPEEKPTPAAIVPARKAPEHKPRPAKAPAAGPKRRVPLLD